MEIRISLNEYADIPFIKKLLSQIKGISDIELVNDNKNFSWEEIENSDDFKKVIMQSEKDFEEGKFVESSAELLDSIFQKR
ncbi:hypothetical protein [Cloacibacterium sp.]|uniref:hypothetical protein n=1 Tax=Cloacibacterium sp. TaxID=1913682 RepID=UPI0035AE5B65